MQLETTSAKQHWFHGGSKALRRLTTPRRHVADEIALTRICGILTLLVILIPITIIESIFLYAEARRGYVLLPTLIGLFIAFGLYKQAQTEIGKWVLVITLWLTAPIAYFGLRQQLSALLIVELVQFPLMALLVAQHVLQRKHVIGLFILTVLFLFSVRISPNPGMSFLFSLLIVIFISSLSLMFAVLNGIDRRARLLAEADRAEREARYRAVTELVSDFVFKLRLLPDGQFAAEWTAGALQNVLGYEPLNSLDAPIPLLPLIVPEDLPLVMTELEKLLRGERTDFEVRVIGKSNDTHWLRIYAHGDLDPKTGALDAIYGAAQDITQQKAAQQALEISEGRLRTIIDSNVMGIILLREEDGVVSVANHNALAMLGYTAEEFIGQAMARQYLSITDRRRIRDIMATTEHVQDIELQARRKDGNMIWASVAITRTMMDGVPMLLSSFFEITARKEAEEALKKQQIRYETLVNSVDGVVWVADAVTLEVEFMSKQIETLSGYSRDRFLREPTLWMSLIHPHDRERAAAIRVEAVQQKRGGFQQEYRMITADGRFLWVRDIVSLTPIGEDQWMMSGLSINITEAKEAQIAEEEQRRLVEGLRSTTAAISGTLNLDEVLDRILEQLQVVIPSDSADIMLIEGRAARLVRSRGYEGRRNMGVDIDDFLFPVFDMPTFQTMMSTGKPLIMDDVSNNPDWVEFGRTTWIQSTVGAPIRLEGSTIGFLNLTSDRKYAFNNDHASVLLSFADQVAIALRNARLYQQVTQYADDLQTQVTQRTSELEFERQRIEAILDSTGDGIVYTEDDIILYTNHTMSDLTGYTAEELINKSVLSISRGGTESQSGRAALDNLIENVQSQGIWRGETEIRRKDGSCFYAELTVSRIGTAGSTPLRSVSTVRDISKEKALQQQQSNLVAYASHELRTPITNLKTRLYLLRRRPEHLEQHLNVLDEVTERMKRLVEDLLDISRLERGVIPMQTQPISLTEHLRQIIAVQKPEADRKGLILIFDTPTRPVYVEADPERFAQVITNLLTNAINYTPSGGIVRLAIEEDINARQVAIHVQDTGIGIAPEHIAHIFQPFYRVVSHVSGTGLGLSIARQIVELHGGELIVTSVPGEGSTFTIKLAIVEAPLNDSSAVLYGDMQV